MRASAFTPESLLREARRQKDRPAASPFPKSAFSIPMATLFDIRSGAGRAGRHPGWACYHTDLDVFREGGHEYGIMGCAVGAAFAVLIAEELFASGCRLLVV